MITNKSGSSKISAAVSNSTACFSTLLAALTGFHSNSKHPILYGIAVGRHPPRQECLLYNSAVFSLYEGAGDECTTFGPPWPDLFRPSRSSPCAPSNGKKAWMTGSSLVEPGQGDRGLC